MPYKPPPHAKAQRAKNQDQFNDKSQYDRSQHPSSEADFLSSFGITKAEFDILMEFRVNHERRSRFRVFLVGVLLMPVTYIGALLGFARSHIRFYESKGIHPFFYRMRPITRLAMFFGAIIVWLFVGCIAFGLFVLFKVFDYKAMAILTYLTVNAGLSLLVLGTFSLWERGMRELIEEKYKFGSARFANNDDLTPYTKRDGYYIGQGLWFNDKGHLFTMAGTRGGKGTSLIIPNLLGAGSMQTSWVVIDPKGENCAITADYQRSSGQNVIILNPWDLLVENIGPSNSFNPLDIFTRITDPNLVDDVQMMAEMIVPITKDERNAFFTDSARAVISGLLLHLVTTQTGQKRSLKTLWEWVRLTGDDWQNLLADMGMNETAVNGTVVQNARREILKMVEAGEETYGSIIATALQSTDFLKSPALQANLESDFDPNVLADGKTTVYVIIPADKLRSHSRWLRIVTTSLMRCVIRAPKNRVTFLLDEFAALGYLPEIETALSTYAGYNVTVWPILQTLIQLEHIYDKNWQTFIANCTVRHYFSINDNHSADYVSKAIGETSHIMQNRAWFGTRDAKSNKRALITPDELRRESGKRIFMFIADLPAAVVNKLPYYLVDDLKSRANPNPYI